MKAGLAMVVIFFAAATIWLNGPLPALAQPLPGTPASSPLVWDSVMKELSPEPGAPSADFTFKVTNSADSEVIISRVQTSCGCTVAKTPPYPWHVGGHSNDSMQVSVNLAAKTGTFTKAITVFATGFPNQVLMVTIHMPDSPEAMRMMNLRSALTDRQQVFKGDCARCHMAPTEGKMGEELFTTACGICHDPKGPGETRATMVPDLRALNHPTDYAFWKMIVTVGKPGTLMPAFGSVAGGPLTDAQVDSLAKTLTGLIPSHMQTKVLNTVPTK
jgi:mono/diheme cytochrome c family protein